MTKIETFEDQLNVLERAESNGMTIEIVEVNQLRGSQSPRTAMEMYFAQQANMRLKQVRVRLNGGAVKVESGALYFSKGNIDCDTQIGGVGGALSKMIKSTLNSEAVFKPVYKGFGEVYLEPTFNHFTMIHLEDESIIVDKGCFYACNGNMKVEPIMQKNLSSAFMGGEGLFQTKIQGTGVVVLQIPVPREEILKYELDGDRLQVDGNFAVLRSGDIKFTVQKSSKTLVSSLLNGEGLLQTFEGKGTVWLAPTSCVYRKLETGGISLVNTLAGSMNNKQ